MQFVGAAEIEVANYETRNINLHMNRPELSSLPIIGINDEENPNNSMVEIQTEEARLSHRESIVSGLYVNGSNLPNAPGTA